MLKLASWNVNSLTVRLEQVTEWLSTSQTDVLGLQETKLVDERFPRAVFEEQGYHVSFCGQKTYNGVALISKYPLHDVVMDIPAFPDPQRRFIVATIQGIRVINLYVPNGAAVDTDKYHYKLGWLSAVRDFIRQQLLVYPNVVVMGDFNIAPQDVDVHDPSLWEGGVLVSPREREALQSMLALGFIDSFRAFSHDVVKYSWWDYRGGSFRRNHGLRIDLILLSEALRARCHACDIDAEPRRSERPSDHTPVWVALIDESA